MDGVNAREKEKTINLTGVNRPSRTNCIMCQQTSQYKFDVYTMFSLKALLFKGVGGDPKVTLIVNILPNFSSTLIIRLSTTH
jgi:hypothetical protein